MRKAVSKESYSMSHNYVNQTTGQKKIWKNNIRTYVLILIGTGLLAFAIRCVYDPCGMVVGGFSGVAILVRSVSSHWIEGGIPLGMTTLILNVPVFVAAYPLKGKAFVKRCLLSTILVSTWLFVMPDIYKVEKDFVLASVFGGIAGGAGIGMVLAAGATTGGTDMLGSLLQPLFPEYSVAQIMAVLDGIIIVAGGFVFGITSALYAVLSVFVTAKVSDAIALGGRYARCVYIITECEQEVSDEILRRLKRGVTSIEARGMYTGRPRKLLYCVVDRKEVVRLKKIVQQKDPAAFVIVNEAQEVLGEGF